MAKIISMFDEKTKPALHTQIVNDMKFEVIPGAKWVQSHQAWECRVPKKINERGYMQWRLTDMTKSTGNRDLALILGYKNAVQQRLQLKPLTFTDSLSKTRFFYKIKFPYKFIKIYITPTKLADDWKFLKDSS